MAFVVRSSGTYVPCTVKNVTQELNGQETASLEFQNDISTRAFVAQDRSIEIYWGGTLIYTGTLQKVAYNEDEPRLSCTVFDTVYDKLDKKPFTHATYDGLTDASDIKHILADAVAVVPGVTSDSDRTGATFRREVRFNRTSVYAVVKYLANNGNADYWTIGGTQIYIGDKGVDRGNIPVQSVSRSEIDRHVKRTAVIVRGYDADGYQIIGTAGDIVNGDVVSYTEYRPNNQAGMDTVAQTKLDSLNKDSSGVSLKVSMAYAYPYMTGDTVTLINEKLALNGTYRIWKITKTENMATIEIDTPEMLLEKYISNQREQEDMGIATGPALMDDPVGPPATPQNFAVVQSNGQLHFSWNANTEADLQRYNIYTNATNDIGTATVLAKTDAISYIWNIPLSTIGTKYYWLSASDRVNNESTKTASINIIIAVPATPTGLAAVAGAMQITLSWTANSETDIKHYNIYKGTTNVVGDAVLFNSINATSFSDTVVVAGTTYYYWLTAKNVLGNESAKSGPVNATAIAGVTKGMQTFNSDIAFSAVDWNTANWTSGTIKFADGDTLTITSGTTGNLAGDGTYYVYWTWNAVTPDHTLRVTSTYSTAVGANVNFIAKLTVATSIYQNIGIETHGASGTTINSVLLGYDSVLAASMTPGVQPFNSNLRFIPDETNLTSSPPTTHNRVHWDNGYWNNTTKKSDGNIQFGDRSQAIKASRSDVLGTNVYTYAYFDLGGADPTTLLFTENYLNVVGNEAGLVAKLFVSSKTDQEIYIMPVGAKGENIIVDFLGAKSVDTVALTAESIYGKDFGTDQYVGVAGGKPGIRIIGSKSSILREGTVIGDTIGGVFRQGIWGFNKAVERSFYLDAASGTISIYSSGSFNMYDRTNNTPIGKFGPYVRVAGESKSLMLWSANNPIGWESNGRSMIMNPDGDITIKGVARLNLSKMQVDNEGHDTIPYVELLLPIWNGKPLVTQVSNGSLWINRTVAT